MTPYGRIGKELCMPEVNTRFNIQLNGEPVSFTGKTNLDLAVLFTQVTTDSIAVELNGEIIDKSLYSSTFLKEGDVLEIIQPLGGGNR